MTGTRKAAMAMMVAAVLAGGQALAEGAAPLAPGKPAGVEQAQRHRGPNLLLIGAAATIVVVAVVVATESSGNASCTTACTVSSTAT